MKINPNLFTLILILLSGLALQANAQEVKVLQESDITEAAIIDALAPEKIGRTRSFRPMDDQLGSEANQKASASMLITFNTNSAELTSGAKHALDKVGRALNMDKLAKFDFVIEGHADLSGSYQLNQRLSAARAETVMDYLIRTHGIEPSRLTAVGKGYTELMNRNNPLAPENRRVT
ncbi:MAG: OmpA family protein, partial [Proteobacteria bacterium]|nr:OmpA family protein [Pseudomonadota bacterium]